MCSVAFSSPHNAYISTLTCARPRLFALQECRHIYGNYDISAAALCTFVQSYELLTKHMHIELNEVVQYL